MYLRSRRVPMALGLASGCATLTWTLWSVFSDTREVGPPLVILTILLIVATLTATFSGPDDALEHTAALRWPPRRAVHLLGAFVVVLLLLLVTLATGARFGPVWLVARDAAGLLGLTALGVVTVGAARSWFLPLGWTLAAVAIPLSGSTTQQILTWQSQESRNGPAALTAGLLAVAGLLGYAVAGPSRRATREITS
ncbi:hypothetical protein ACIG87_14210 [Micromonospora sp. NPDC051925]|uniref:hypothetical protein n=1 Tax=Micromonospora sp. NPDC051925 TaxID=3364288 RepID=UPI0037C90760